MKPETGIERNFNYDFCLRRASRSSGSFRFLVPRERGIEIGLPRGKILDGGERDELSACWILFLKIRAGTGLCNRGRIEFLRNSTITQSMRSATKVLLYQGLKLRRCDMSFAIFLGRIYIVEFQYFGCSVTKENSRDLKSLFFRRYSKDINQYA